MNENINPNNNEKVDIESILRSFKINNLEVFKEYLKEVWVDLTSRSEEKKGINKLTFSSYYQLPGIISLYLFNVFDKKNKGYITIKEFLKGMVTLFCEDFEKNSKFIFDFYDNDKDGLISKEDIRTVLSYVTLNNNENNNTENNNTENNNNNETNNNNENNAENINNKENINNLNNNNNHIHNLYLQRVHSQEELYHLLEISFKNLNKEKINYEEFLNIIENTASDIYMMLLLFLLEKKPFKKFGINEYKKQKLPLNSPKTKRNSININSKLIASPIVNQNSSISSMKIFIRESKKRKTISMTMNKINKQRLLNGYLETEINQMGRTRKRGFTLKGEAIEQINAFLKQKMKKTFNEEDNNNDITEDEDDAQNNNNNSDVNNENYYLHYYSSHEEDEKVPVTRKTKTDLKHINEEGLSRKVYRNIEKYNDIGLMPAYKQNEIENNKNKVNNNKGSNEVSESCGSIFSDEKNINSKNNSNSSLFNFHNNSDSFSFSHSSSNSDSEEEDVIKLEGHLYKMIDNKKLKRLYFKLIHKDLYFFKNEKEKSHKGMHNLSGVFIKENPTNVFNDMTFYSFSLIFPSKTRIYYTPKKADYEKWVNKLKEATGYTNLMDIYEIGKKLGNGKFGLVKRGVNKKTKKEVAIKIMAKNDMKNEDMELVRTEIEILKICQHPNIIHLYEVFENKDYYYIIMECCSGGDLFSYIEKRHFKLPEKRACEIVYKILLALFYLHSYGIIHRDIKPENILMVNSTENSDIRLVDFGLSKILGPNEFCTEPYGTLSYVAPEVLLEKPYNNKIDCYSLGVATYLMVSGSLPFDHPKNDKEIARQTVQDEIPFKKIVWKNISEECVLFIKGLMEKNPEKRMSVKDALDHDWIKMNITKRKNEGFDKMKYFKYYTSGKE